MHVSIQSFYQVVGAFLLNILNTITLFVYVVYLSNQEINYKLNSKLKIYCLFRNHSLEITVYNLTKLLNSQYKIFVHFRKQKVH